MASTARASNPNSRFNESVWSPIPWNIPQSNKTFLPLISVIKCLEPVTVLAAPWNAIFIELIYHLLFFVYPYNPTLYFFLSFSSLLTIHPRLTDCRLQTADCQLP